MSHHTRSIGILIPLLLACTLCGCVSRRLTIRSDPPGALVELDGRRMGYTPVSVDFTYYATNEVTLSKVGFEPLTVQQPVPAPWYQHFPLDFVSDNFLLTQVTNRHDFTYRLQPKLLVSDEELLDRANLIRTQSHGSP
jgi:hypothetical protein